MKFHPPSFFIGFVSATVLSMTGKRLRPVAVELGALGMHLGHLTWGVMERQREHVEDLWAEMRERAHERHRGTAAGPQRPVTQSVRIEPTRTVEKSDGHP